MNFPEAIWLINCGHRIQTQICLISKQLWFFAIPPEMVSYFDWQTHGTCPTLLCLYSFIHTATITENIVYGQGLSSRVLQAGKTDFVKLSRFACSIHALYAFHSGLKDYCDNNK